MPLRDLVAHVHLVHRNRTRRRELREYRERVRLDVAAADEEAALFGDDERPGGGLVRTERMRINELAVFHFE